MSRDHAEINLDVEEGVRERKTTCANVANISQAVTIQDIGSMHGTFLNGAELPRNTPMAIDDGDIIVFGAEVRRGPETFPACKFEINYEFVQYK